MTSDNNKRNGFTWMQWQNQGQLPYGFANSDESYRHWDQGNDLGWAIFQWNQGHKTVNNTSSESGKTL